MTNNSKDGPRNSLEARIFSTWSRILGNQDFGVLDNFFHIGGTSILCFELARQLEPLTNEAVSAATIVENPTIRGLARRLEARSKLSHGSSIVRIADNGSAPIVFIHSLSGSIFPYHTLAHYMQNAHSILGVEAPILSGGDMHSSIEGIASDYIGSLSTLGLDNNLKLGGYSFGAHLAFEIARQLTLSGKTIKKLILIAPDERPSNATMSKEKLVKAASAHLERRQASHGSDPQTNELLFKTYLHNLSALSSYSEQPVRLNAALICPEDDHNNSNAEKFWDRMCEGGVAEYRRVRGDHFSIFHPPHISELADCVDHALI